MSATKRPAKSSGQSRALSLSTNTSLLTKWARILGLPDDMAGRHPGPGSGIRCPGDRGGNVSTIGAIALDGIRTGLSVPGAIDGETMLFFVEELLVPTLTRGEIVCMDNNPIHKLDEIEDAIEAVGAGVLFLPAYSPDLNPIENCWSKVKSRLRSLKPRTLPDLLDALVKAFSSITGHDILGWFRHCGYRIAPICKSFFSGKWTPALKRNQSGETLRLILCKLYGANRGSLFHARTRCSHAALAAHLGLSRQWTCVLIARLRDAGWITTEAPRLPDGKQEITTFKPGQLLKRLLVMLLKARQRQRPQSRVNDSCQKTPRKEDVEKNKAFLANLIAELGQKFTPKKTKTG